MPCKYSPFLYWRSCSQPCAMKFGWSLGMAVPWYLFHLLRHPRGKRFFLPSAQRFLVRSLVHCLCSCHCAPLRRAWPQLHSICLEHQPLGQQKDLHEMPVPNLRREGAQAITSQPKLKINTKSVCILNVLSYGKTLSEKRSHTTQKGYS